MQQCDHKGCKYKTNVSSRMTHHKLVSGHGRTDAGKKQFKGHLAIRGKKKSKG